MIKLRKQKIVRSTLGQLALLLLLLTIALPGFALDNTAIISLSNDSKEIALNKFTLEGIDPFFAAKVEKSVSRDVTKETLILHFKLDGADLDKKLPIEIFFKPILQGEQTVFDPLYIMQFQLDPRKLNSNASLAVQLPEEIDVQQGQLLRLDIDNCRHCTIEFLAKPSIVNATNNLASQAQTAHPTRVFNGAKSLPKSGQNLDLSHWHLNHLDGEYDELSIIGDDPFMVSSRLDIDTNTLGGALFTVISPETVGSHSSFQVFYATDTHAFVERASTVLQTKLLNNGRTQFLVPLHFLSEEKPRALLLERLRLDIIPNSEFSQAWNVEEIRLLNKNQMSEFNDRIPSRLIQSKFQRASGFSLIKKSVKKILRDIPFTLAYLLVLILTTVGIVRAYRR